MPWYQGKVAEVDLGDLIAGLLMGDGWHEIADFYRIVVNKVNNIEFACAHHYLLKSITGKNFGIACSISFSINIDDEKYVVRTGDYYESDWKSFALDCFEHYEEHNGMPVWFVYTFDNYFGPKKYFYPYGENDFYYEDQVLFNIDVDIIKASLDIENFINGFFYETNQSPIVPVRLRDVGDIFNYNSDFEVESNNLNWWGDSEVRILGHHNNKCFFFVLQADNVPDYEQPHNVPTIPLFFGDFKVPFSIDIDQWKNWDGNVVLFAGTSGNERKNYLNISSVTLWQTHPPHPPEIPYVYHTVEAKDFGIPKDFDTTCGGKVRYIVNYDEDTGIVQIQIKNLGPGEICVLHCTVILESGQTGSDTQLNFHDIPVEEERTYLVDLSDLGSVLIGSFDLKSIFNTSLNGNVSVSFGEQLGKKSINPLKRNYDNSIGDGLHHVIVSKDKYGQRYKAHYLSWLVPTNSMPPVENETQDFGLMFERVGGRLDKESFYYNFNPSKYSNFMETSKVYIVHPEYGVYGWLPNALFVHPINLGSGEIVDVFDRQICGNTVEFNYQLITAKYSPLTFPLGIGSIPSSHFRPAGLCICMEDVDCLIENFDAIY